MLKDVPGLGVLVCQFLAMLDTKFKSQELTAPFPCGNEINEILTRSDGWSI